MAQLSSLPIPPATPKPVHSNDQANLDRSHCKKKKKPIGQGGSSYLGKCEEIKLHVYDIGPTISMDLSTKTTREIGKYLAHTIKNGSEFQNTFDPEKLGFQSQRT
jgi:hypothetical protein